MFLYIQFVYYLKLLYIIISYSHTAARIRSRQKRILLYSITHTRENHSRSLFYAFFVGIFFFTLFPKTLAGKSASIGPRALCILSHFHVTVETTLNSSQCVYRFVFTKTPSAETYLAGSSTTVSTQMSTALA